MQEGISMKLMNTNRQGLLSVYLKHMSEMFFIYLNHMSEMVFRYSYLKHMSEMVFIYPKQMSKLIHMHLTQLSELIPMQYASQALKVNRSLCISST